MQLIAQDCGEHKLEDEESIAVLEPHTADMVSLLIIWKVNVANIFDELLSSRHMLIKCCRYIDERGIAFFDNENITDEIYEIILSELSIEESFILKESVLRDKANDSDCCCSSSSCHF
jgi:hypothetical protein